MEVKELHSWQVSPVEALAIQLKMASLVSRRNELHRPRYIAGIDISVNKVQGLATGAAVVLKYPELELVETSAVSGKLNFPYVPGLLSFREAPLALAACQRLSLVPDLFFVDGQGMAHPRRFGLACHLGLFLDAPTIGCAKSRLCGSHEEPGDNTGSYTQVVDRGETIGAALRTKPGVKPVYVSVGHKVDLEAAIYWVLACCRGYRLPEPCRRAHLAAIGQTRSENMTGGILTGCKR